MDSIGFIMLRHVRDDIASKYWIICYNSIRKFYPEFEILIIDDNSDYNFICNYQLYKTTVINSKFNNRGELLPYIYYIKHKLFDKAVIIHDSVFIQQYVDFSDVTKYKFIWDFEHNWDQIEDETKMIKIFNDKDLLDFYENKNLWTGCFGGMCIIEYDFLLYINKKYNLNKLINLILSRYNRCSFERVIACILQKEYPKEVLFGQIHKYCPWGLNFSEISKYKHLPFIKIWSGR